MPDEDRAGMVDFFDPRIRVVERQFQMLRRNPVGDGHGLVHVAHQNEGPAIGQRGADDLLTRHGRQQLLDAGLHLVEEGRIGTDQDRLRQFIMLGLREQIHRHPVRIAGTIRNDQDFRRTGHHVDADNAEDAALGGRHIGVARPDDLVYLRDRFRAVCQRPDRLRTADGEHTIDPGQAGRRQHQRILLAARGRHDHDQFLDARHLGRHRVHQHRRRISRLAPRHIEADAVERGNHLAEHRPVGFGIGPALLDLALMIGAHPARGGLQCCTAIGRQAVQRSLKLCLAEFEIGHGRH